MRKTKLFIVALLAMLGLSANAQSWTAASLEAGDFVLYNVGKSQVFTKGNAWGTQASMTSVVGEAIQVALVSEGDYYVINTKVGNDAWGLEQLGGADNVYTDQSRDKKSTWNFVSAGSNAYGPIYYIIAQDNHNGGAGGYLAAHAENTVLTGNDDGSTDFAKWQLVAPDQVEALGDYLELLAAKDQLGKELASANDYYTYSNDNGEGTAKAALKDVIDTAQGVYDDAAATAGDYSDQADALADAIAVYILSGATPMIGHPWDMTFKIVNPSFDAGNFNGWTATSTHGGKLAIQGGSRMEYWGGQAYNRAEDSFNVYQEITGLPDGIYTISADMYNSLNGEGGDYTVFSPTCGVYGKSFDEQVTLVDVEGEVLNTYTTDEITVYGGKLIVGVKNTVTPIAARWFLFDNFKLSFIRQFEAAEYLAIAKAAYDIAKADAEAVVSGSIPTAAYTALQTVISDNTITSGTVDDYNAATAALMDATDAANALIEPFANYIATKPIMVAITDQDVYTDGSGAKTTFNNAIDAADLAVNEAIDVDGINAQTKALATAVKAFIKEVDINDGKFFDLTSLIVNPHFTEGKGGKDIPTGWTLESGAITEHRLLTHNFETYHAKFNLSQTLVDMPKGTYKVTLQGFARHDGADVDKTNLYCGIVEQPIKNIRDEYSTTSFYDSETPALGDNNRDASYQLEGNTVYQPNGMTGAYYWFQQENPETAQPFYTNEVQTLVVNDGALKIGFKCETTTDWVIWDNFHLYYYGSDINITLDEATGSAFSEEFTATNLTLKKEVIAGYNTIILPFEIMKAELGAKDIYSYRGDDENGVLQFRKASKIQANTPYLAYFEEDINTPFELHNIEIEPATESLMVEGEAFNFVGTFGVTTAVAAGDYILGENEFVVAKGGNKIKAFRAYIKANAPAEARTLQIAIDGVTTAIEAIDGKAVNNAAIYNLAGQQVKKAQKGLYIQNGKKMVVK